jgi:hypothetical protein
VVAQKLIFYMAQHCNPKNVGCLVVYHVVFDGCWPDYG